MEKVALIRPHEDYASQIEEYKREFIACGSSMDGCATLGKTENAFVGA